MIRDATYADIDQLMSLFRAAHAGSPFKATTIDERHIRRMLAIGTCTPNFLCLVVEHDGELVGVLGAAVDKNIWGMRVATDLVFFSRRETDRLIRRFVEWARERGAEMVNITDLSGNERYRDLIKMMGLEETGQNFSKVI